MRVHRAQLLAFIVLACAGCGSNPSVTLAQLAQSQQDYVGQQVLTRGTVRLERNSDGSSYYVLSDAHGALVGLDPAQKVRPFEGRIVQVGGLFEVQPGFGRIIHVVFIALVIDNR